MELKVKIKKPSSRTIISIILWPLGFKIFNHYLLESRPANMPIGIDVSVKVPRI